MIWANLIHLGYNMWCDHTAERSTALSLKPYLRFDETLWRELLQRMASAGMNMVILDLGEGVKYSSHPEISVRGSWQPAKLKTELNRARDLGIEPIPKLNFSTAHDTWLGPYSRCVSTDTYYRVCRDLIEEVSDIFQKPRFFHLGMDEETASHQGTYEYAVARQHDLWWHDLRLLVAQVERCGIRPWIWSDEVWRQPEEFVRRMPKTVLQSNWYYSGSFEQRHGTRHEYQPYNRAVGSFDLLETNRYDQVPTGMSADPSNFIQLVDYCKRHVASKRLMGFMQTTWRPTLPAYRACHLEAIEQVQQGMACWQGKLRNVAIENPQCSLIVPPRPGIRVGVYQSGYGAGALARTISKLGRYNVFPVPRLDRRILRETEVLIISVPRSPHFFAKATGLLRRWVKKGGRLMLLHGAVGYRQIKPIFPNVAGGLTNPRSRRITIMARHAAVAGLAKGAVLRHAYFDHVAMNPGAMGKTIARDDQGHSVLVAGKIGSGKIILNGMLTGYAGKASGDAEGEHLPTGGERTVLHGCLKWLAEK